MVLSIFFLPVLLRLVSGGILLLLLGSRPGLPLLGNLAGLSSISRLLSLMLGGTRFSADLCGRKVFRGGPLLDIHGSMQLLNSSHVRERER